MTALNFPGSPTLNQVYTANGKTFVWDGTSWRNTTPKTFTGLNINGAITERIEVTTNLLNGTTNFNAKSYGVLYNTVTAMENWTLNVRGDESTSLNTMLSVGQSLTAVHIVTMGATSYSPTLHIDGSAATVNWQTTATLSAYTNCSVIYTFFILKTAANTFTVLGSQTPFILSNNGGGGGLLYVYRAGAPVNGVNPWANVPTLIDQLYETPLTISPDNEQAVSVVATAQYFVQNNGTLWKWGMDVFSSAPEQVGTDTDWASVYNLYNSIVYALKQDGTLWGKGTGTAGIFGNIPFDGEGVGPEGAYRTNESSSYWRDVVTLEQVEYDAEREALGEIEYHTDYYAGILSTANPGVVEFDQGLFDAGAISLYPQFANSHATDLTEFVQITTDDNWAKIYIAEYNGNPIFGAVIKTDGAIWLFGDITSEDDRNGYTPTPLSGNNTGWEKIVSVQSLSTGAITWFGLKTNGTLWRWDGDIRSVAPQQVGSDTNWSDISSSGYDSILLLKTNGTLWGAGTNQYGRLGNGLTSGSVSLSSITQIGSDTNWAKIYLGPISAAAVKTNGTLWVTGQSATLGLGNTTNTSGVWTQVGSRTNWVSAWMSEFISIFLSTSDS